MCGMVDEDTPDRRCGVEDEHAPGGRCIGVLLQGTHDGRCIADTADGEARDAAFQRLREGGDLDFTQGVPIDGDLLSGILDACPRVDGRRRLHNANFGSSRFVSVAGFAVGIR